MLRNLTSTSLVLCAALAATLLSPAEASADCRRGDRRCKRANFQLHVPGRVHIHASASASFGVRTPHQVVVVRPTPPPPPPPPPPPVVVVRPQPQVTIQQPQVIVRPAPAPVLVQQPQRNKNFGVRIAFGGMGGDVSMVGGQLAFKYRPRMGFFALEVAGGVYGGDDYNGLDRVETPFTLGAQFYFNPRSKFQIFALVGVGGSVAEVNGYSSDPFYDRYASDEYSYLGGFAGLGAELRLGRWFAISGDLRAFLRDRVDIGADSNPEFYDADTGKTTNTSTGILATVGGTFYF